MAAFRSLHRELGRGTRWSKFALVQPELPIIIVISNTIVGTISSIFIVIINTTAGSISGLL